MIMDFKKKENKVSLRGNKVAMTNTVLIFSRLLCHPRASRINGFGLHIDLLQIISRQMHDKR